MNRDEIATLFRQNLYNFHVEAGYSECSLSKTIDKSAGYIQSISSGRNLPSFSSFMDICEVTHREPAEFFLDSDTKVFLRNLGLDPDEFTLEQKCRIIAFAKSILDEETK